MTVESLSVALWRQRDILTEIHHQLYVQSLLLRDGAANHHLARATRVINRLENEATRVSLLVHVNLDMIAEDWGLTGETTLSALTEAAPDQVTKEILTGHLTALEMLTDTIRQYASENKQTLDAILGTTKSELADPNAYSEDGSVLHASHGPLIERTL